MKPLNLALRFLLELATLGALAYWGFSQGQSWLVRLLVGLGLPGLVAVLWGAFVSPKAPRRLSDPARLGLELVIFGSGAVALWLAGRPRLAVGLAVLVVLNEVLLFTCNQRRH